MGRRNRLTDQTDRQMSAPRTGRERQPWVENKPVPAGLLGFLQENELVALRAKTLRVRKGERCGHGAPHLLETLPGAGIPGEGSAEQQPSLRLSALLSISPRPNAFFKTCLQLLHWKILLPSQL